MTGLGQVWTEVAAGCYVRRYQPLDVSCTLIVGEESALVVDTRASAEQGRALAADVAAVTARQVSSVVNTHVHFDHLLGNGAFAGAALIAHDSVPGDLSAHLAHVRELYATEPDDPYRAEVLGTEPVAPAVTFSSVLAVDLGGRHVEVAHLGRGHTAGDVVVRVPDADLVCAGDLVEESGPPAFGVDCWPLDWGRTVESLTDLLGQGTAVVPGHGRVVDRDFVLAQRADVVAVAEQVRELAAAAVPVDDALERGSWPYPAERLQHAVRRGYAHLG